MDVHSNLQWFTIVPWTVIGPAGVGSLTPELLAWIRCYHTAEPRLPPRFGRVGFWISQLVLAAVAGGLAEWEEAKNPLAAFTIGIGALAILEGLGRLARDQLEAGIRAGGRGSS